MKSQYLDIIKHSGVYGLGEVLTRVVSIVMLPLYTRLLTPTDYGTIAILDLTTALLGILLTGGIGTALTRYHYEATTPEQQDTVWWTSLGVTAVTGGVIVGPALLLREPLASFTLGPEEHSGGYFYVIALTTLWFSMIGNLPTVYFRLRMRSWLTINLSLAGLMLNVALNVYFLAVLRWGISGILMGNLVTTIIMTSLRLLLVMRENVRFRFDLRLALELSRFGTPLVATMLLATAMHQADRYLLRQFLDLEDVGVYSLAYQMGQGLNALLLVPFSMIWGVALYEIARQPDAQAMFAQVFEYFVYALLLLLFGVSLFIKPLMTIFVAPEYAGAAELVPIICLSFVFFSIDEHFRVPALLAKRTVSLVPGYAAGAAANIVLNSLLLPRFGMIAAAWVSVLTYAVFAAVALWQARRIERYGYPLGRCAAVIAALSLSFVMCEHTSILADNSLLAVGLRALVWLVWAAVLSYLLVKQHGRREIALVRP